MAVVRLDGSIEFLRIDYDRTDGTVSFYFSYVLKLLLIKFQIRVRKIELLKSVRAHQKPVCRIAIWKSQLITSSFDRSIKMWNWAENPEQIDISNVFLAHNSPVVNLAVDEATSIMYSSCEEGVICWWNLNTGELIRTNDNNYTWAFQLATSSDYLLGFYGSSQLYMWNVENGQLACRVSDALGDGTVRFWNSLIKCLV